jgi:hypothetical protein
MQTRGDTLIDAERDQGSNGFRVKLATPRAALKPCSNAASAAFIGNKSRDTLTL